MNYQKIILEQVQKQYQTPDFLAFKNMIQTDNENLTLLENSYEKQVYFSGALSIISSLPLPSGLHLTSLSLNRDENQNINVTASGFCKSREDLLAFQKSIQQIKEIKDPSFSPESWVEAQNVTFSVTFQISK